MIITSNNREIKNELKALEKILVDNGAWIHPDFAIRYSTKTGLSVYMEGDAPQQDYIIAVPGDLLIPADSINLSVRGDDLVSDPDVDRLSPVQLEITGLLVSIYNHTDKVAFFKAECPWIRFQQAPELMYQLLKARTMSNLLHGKMSFMYGTDKKAGFDEFIINTFISSRAVGFKSSGAKTGRPCFMPIVDAMNHDYRGSRYVISGWDNVENGLRVHGRKPIPGNRECYAYYGMYDGLDTFLKYGFYDRESPFIRSIPLEIPVEGVGNIIISSSVKGSNKKNSFGKVASELQMFMPSVNRLENGNFQVSDLFISIAPFPHALGHILRILFTHLLADTRVARKFIIDQLKNAESVIISNNLNFYHSLIKTLNENDTAPQVLVSDIQEIATYQIEKLNQYRGFNFEAQ